ncbi:MAG: NADP-dependent malic enzyme, partial [Gammaproteobacteria bacterium]|nr:NADP-dependent malic enzyme [Gammaproteobacteria bacterium]
IEERIRELGLRIRPGGDFELVDPMNNPNFERDWQTYHRIMGRKGVTPSFARTVVSSRRTALAALMVEQNDVDAMICGAESAYMLHLPFIKNIIGIRGYLDDCAAITLLILPSGTFFITDTHVSENPSARQIATNTAMAAEVVRNFGLIPKAALLSHSSFGSWDSKQVRKMQKARRILREKYPHLAVEGEMQADAALSDEIRDRLFPNSRFEGQANLLVMPGLSAANISYNMVKILGDAVPVGPMLIGTNKPAHIVTNSATVRAIVNLAAIAVVDAQVRQKRKAEKAYQAGRQG